MSKPALHFVGFRSDLYSRDRGSYLAAVKVWGPPDIVHIGWDRRAQRDIGPDDIVVFAKGEHDQEVSTYNFPDMIHGPIHLFC